MFCRVDNHYISMHLTLESSLGVTVNIKFDIYWFLTNIHWKMLCNKTQKNWVRLGGQIPE